MSRAAHCDLRQKILDASEERLWRYGFKKTTIDEIAADAEVGKGTVYLYFDGKDAIGLAIMARYREAMLAQVADIAHDQHKDPVQKLKAMLTQPILGAHQRCRETPATLELVVALKPQFREHMKGYSEQEDELLAQVLEDGNRQGIFAVADTKQAARTLKFMCAGFWPLYPWVTEPEQIAEEISRIVDLATRGLRNTKHAK